MEERLQKLISRAGLASRRKAEQLIQDGRVTVNGIPVTELGAKADPALDEVRLDGKIVRPEGAGLYFILHKPEGYVTTMDDPEGRPKAPDLLKGVKARLHPVGRLDYATSGLLILTTDGDLTRKLTRPSSKIPKTYQVKVRERIGQDKIKLLAAGPDIGGPRLRPARVKFVRASRSGRHSWIEMTITEGKTRQIRRMCEAVGHQVIKLKRVAIGPLKLTGLGRGEFRPLTEGKVRALREYRPPRPLSQKPRGKTSGKNVKKK